MKRAGAAVAVLHMEREEGEGQRGCTAARNGD